MLSTVSLDTEFVTSISLQPGSDGKVFAASCGKYMLCIYDTRRSMSGEFFYRGIIPNRFAHIKHFFIFLFNISARVPVS